MRQRAWFLGPSLVADGCRQPYQIGELRLVVRVEDALFRPHAKDDFLVALEVSWIMRDARLGEFEPMPPK